MVTKLYLLQTAAAEPKPNVKQSPTSINQWVYSVSFGGGQDSASVIYPLEMKTSKGSLTYAILESITEPGSPHYAWFKAWVSEALSADQTISGTLTVVFDLNEGATAHNMMLRIRVYVWKSDDSGVRGTLLADTDSTVEADTTDGTKQTLFTGVSLTSVNALAGDRIVIEVMAYDNNTKTTAYLHKIAFGDSGTSSDSYIEFSQDITFGAILKTVTDSLGLSDVVLRDKPLCLVSDSLGLADSLLRDKSFTVNDSLGLSDVPRKDWTPQVMDSIGLTETLFLAKLKSVLDSLGLSDAVLRDKSFTIQDSLGLSDAVLRDKILQILDSLGLTDVPYKNWTPKITDSVGLSDQVLRDKVLQIFDSLGLIDSILRDRVLSVADSVGLSEIVDVIVGAIIKYVTDSLGLSDVALINKTLPLADSIGFTEQVLRHKSFTVSDLINLSDSILRDKVLVVTDLLGLVEAVVIGKMLLVSDQVAFTDLAQIPSKIMFILDSATLTELVYRVIPQAGKITTLYQGGKITRHMQGGSVTKYTQGGGIIVLTQGGKIKHWVGAG